MPGATTPSSSGDSATSALVLADWGPIPEVGPTVLSSVLGGTLAGFL